MSVCLSRTSGLTQEQRGLGRLKLAHVTWTPLSRSKGQRSACCWCLKQPTCRNRCHLANKYEDIVHLQEAEAHCAATRIVVITIICHACYTHVHNILKILRYIMALTLHASGGTDSWRISPPCTQKLWSLVPLLMSHRQTEKSTAPDTRCDGSYRGLSLWGYSKQVTRPVWPVRTRYGSISTAHATTYNVALIKGKIHHTPLRQHRQVLLSFSKALSQ